MSAVFLARSDADIAETFPVMSLLRPHLAEGAYVQLVRELQRSGYQLASLRDEQGVVVAVAGFRVGHSLAWGKYLYVDDLVSDEGARSKGLGGVLLRWLEELGRAEGCAELHLDSGVQRTGAHRFYLRERMDIVFFHFRKAIG